MPWREVGVTCPAKINFGLRILSRRPDGYHAIETILQMLDFGDWLGFRVNDTGTVALTCHPSTLPTDERNLVVRAARALQQLGHVEQGVDLLLEKAIPIAAGLGGGSSNAAMTLLTLNTLWGFHCPRSVLHDLAMQLGSDVPFFLGGPTALARGRGEILCPLPPPPLLTGVLVNPGFGVSAGWAYGQFNGRSSATAQTVPTILRALHDHDLALLAAVMVNDLEPGVAAVYPIIREIQQALRAVGAVVTFMSGSGPTVCGIFPDMAAAQQAATTFASRHTWTVRSFATRCQSPHRALRG